MSSRTPARIAILATIWAMAIAPETATSQVGLNQGVLNPNLASRDSLVAVPSLDAATVDGIVDGRPFLRMVELDALLTERLGEFDRNALYREVFVPINLNGTTEEEVLLIPGVGPRLAHEFEEYRPYVHLAEFRREIGKYVDEEEVARLEQFVFVPIDLNEASDEDVLTIPGLGDRILHEFREYRPSGSIEQFRREIGKYVDDGELARLERYVTLD